MYELFIESRKADINEQISVQLTFAIDDVANFASRETGFSKQIVLPGTAANHSIFGHIHEMGSNNPFSPGQPNIGSSFNVAQVSRAELRLNGLLVLRGVFRLTGIVKTGDMVEYEGAIFGELSGLMSEISNKKLEDLDFSAYDHTLTHTAISNSWDNTPGSGYFYPLIDYGLYREDAVVSGLNDDYEIGTFRPALYVKEYIDKMFTAAGYSYDSTFFNSAYFKSLIIPHNTKELEKISSDILTATLSGGTITTSAAQVLIAYNTAIGGDFTINGAKTIFEYNDTEPLNITISVSFRFFYTSDDNFDIALTINNNVVDFASFTAGTNEEVLFTLTYNGALLNGDQIRVALQNDIRGSISITGLASTLDVNVEPATVTRVDVNDTVQVNYVIPRGIFQKDFFASIIKMFNLYVTEDRLEEKKLYIEPYIDFMTGETLDWTYKVARDKAWQIVPMGNLNGRIFEYKYKEDSDFYNESYKKKFNQSYADRQFDTGFQFSQDKKTTDIIFASSPLIKYDSSDKFVVPIYKKSNELSAEDRMDSNIRILFSKKLSCDSWNIKVGATNNAKTSYGYAGHLDDPINPQFDLNFGAPNETYFTPTTYPSANLFNRYWSAYIAEIADKDSKILNCYVYLRALDIAQLDFAKAVFIDGIRFRINKVSDYDYTNNELVKVELLKIINNE